MRKLLIGLAGMIVLLLAAALVVPSVVDWNSYKGEIARQVKAATGRDLAIRGNLDLAVLPSPRLSVADVRFASIPGAADPDMVRLRSLDVRVRFLPLLRGRIEVASVTLIDPVIVLETLADGRANWTFPANGGPAPGGAPAPSPPSGRGAGASAAAIGVDSLRIRGGTLVYRDGAARTEERIERLEANVAVTSLSGPARLTGSMTARGVPLGFDLAIGRMAPDGGLATVALALTLPNVEAKAEFNGTLAGVPDAIRLNGRIDASGKDFARVIAAASGGATARSSLPPMVAQPFALKARVNGTDQGGALNDVELEFGGARATGEASVAIGERVRADAKLRVARIDLGRWLAMPAPPAGQGPGPGVTAPAAQPLAPPAASTPFALPANVNGTLDLTVAAVTLNGEAIQDVRLVAQLTEGALTLKQASLRLPGGGDASLNGALTAKNGRPDFDGSLDVRADNLRALFGWMKVDLAGIPADRLRKFALSTRLKSDDRQLQVLGAKISLDTSRIDAGVTLALRERLAFGASVTVDQLNLDAYMPPAEASGGPAPSAGAPASPAPQPANAGSPLATLNSFDANLRLQIASLTYRRTPVRNLRFDGTLAQGQLTIRDASIGNLAGTSARINGTLGGFDKIPVFRGGFAADSNDVSGLMRVAGIEPPPAARSLGKVSLRGKADGGAERVNLDTTLDLAGGKLTVAGTLDGLTTAPKFDAKIGADHADPARLARAFGMDLPAGQKLGPLALSIALKGDQSAVNADAKLRALGGEVALAGGLSGLTTGALSLDGTLAASHPSYNALMQGLAPDYRPAGRNIGPVRLEAKLKGTPTGADLTGLTAQAGKAALSGQGRLALDGPRPKLVAALTGGVVDLNPFLPADDQPGRTARPAGVVPPPGGGGSGSAGERFSSEPYDFAALGDADADLSIGTEAIVWKNIRIDKPAVKMTLADSLLTIEQVAGRMFDGSFLMKGKLNAKGQPALDGSVTVEKANVGKALLDAAAFDVAGGIMDFTMAVAGSGVSPKAMVSSLNGDGRLNVQNGVVKGFDLKAVSERLKNIDRGLDILRLFGSAMGGGETRFTSLAGTFKMDKGVLRTSDLTMVADAGEGRATGSADLPRWTMDFNTQFRLTEHPRTPPFGMTLRGPLDNPQRIFQVQDLQNHLLQRGVGTLLRKLAPGSQPQSQDQQQAPAAEQQPQQQPQPQQQQPPQRPRPEDILKGLLKGLGR